MAKQSTPPRRVFDQTMDEATTELYHALLEARDSLQSAIDAAQVVVRAFRQHVTDDGVVESAEYVETSSIVLGNIIAAGTIVTNMIYVMDAALEEDTPSEADA